ncbi:MAG: site-2 protease family protein [Gemmatimonadota bacterium]|nr:MAG: site-2 protease family protein [Gemmatimonadota bacterium]
MTLDSNSQSTRGQGPLDHLAIFALCRVESVPAGRLVTGRLRPELTPESPEVRQVLADWPGSVGRREGPEGWEVFLFEPAARRERWWLHIVLLVATLFSTVVAGSLLTGHAPIWFQALRLFGGWWVPIPVAVDLGALVPGLPFGLALVGVLALHEAGHYFAARHHRISVTPPFFIPFPPYVSVIGTLGAFIRLRSPVLSRSTLLDVGVAGPLLSFLASLPLLWWGLAHSRVIVVAQEMPTGYLVRFATERFWLGGSLAMSGLARLALDLPGTGQVVELHPLAFAGWLGLFVTALNLLPISQLDGGHLLYALLGQRQRLLAWVFFLALIPLGFHWAGWWVWAVLVFAVGRGRIRHPPLYNSEEGPDRVRVAIGVAAAVAFVLCFVPVPFRL